MKKTRLQRCHRGVAPTAAKEGNSTYWHCDKYFSDEKAQNEIKKEDTKPGSDR